MTDKFIDIDAAFITLKIVGSILCGVATAYFEYWLFSRFAVALAFAPVGRGLVAASLFAPAPNRNFYLTVLFAFFVLSLCMGGLARIPAHVYFWTFAVLGLVLFVGLVLYFLASVVPEVHGGAFPDATPEECKPVETKIARRTWTYSARNRI